MGLSFLSKLLERAGQQRRVASISVSTETAVLKVLAADSGQVSALCLLDLTAAFDTVDHDLLMLRLECQFGLRDVVIQWFCSYLSVPGSNIHL